MPPRVTSKNTPLPAPRSLAPVSRRTSTRTNNPTATTTESQDGQVPVEASDSQTSASGRPRRATTPTKRSLESRAQQQRRDAIRTRREQTEAVKPSGKNGGKYKGKGARASSTAPSARSTVDTEEDDGGDEPGEDGASEDGADTHASGPHELLKELAGATYEEELNDPGFCSGLTEKINNFIQGKGAPRKYTRETLQEALRIARRAPSIPNEASQWSPLIFALPERVLSGGGGYHLSHGARAGDKRRLEPSQPSTSAKRSRVGSPSTVSNAVPSPFGLSRLGGQPGDVGPPGLPLTAVRPAHKMPRELPRSNAMYIQDKSPSPLPASFRPLEDTQMVPEDDEPDLNANPVGLGPTPSSPDLGVPPSGVRQSVSQLQPSRSESLGRNSASQVALARVVCNPAAVTSYADELEKMARTFDNNERLRARAFAIRQDRLARNLERDDEDDEDIDDDYDLAEDDAAERSDKRRAAQGKPAKRNKKTGLNCVSGRPRPVGSRAVTNMTAYGFSIGPYVPRISNLILALEAYERAWKVEFPDYPIEPAPASLVCAIADRAPAGRSVAKANLRPIMTSNTGFGFIANPSTQAQIDANVALYQSIREDFHFKSLDQPGSHYEHPALVEAFVAAFFDGDHSPCTVYHTYFKPAVPPQTVGVLLTLIESCIAEWSTGVHKKQHLNWRLQAVIYEKHMANLDIFADSAPARWERFRKSLYAAGW